MKVRGGHRSTGIDAGLADGDPHGLRRRLQDHGELVGAGGLGEVRVHGLEAHDLVEAVLEPQPPQRPHRVCPVRVRENLPESEKKNKDGHQFREREIFSTDGGKFFFELSNSRFSFA